MFAFLTALLLASAPAQETEVKGLIEKLGDDRFATREQAHRRLLEIGVPALEQLETGAKSPDLERRRRCESILESIRYTELWKPTKLDYRCEDRKASQVLADLAKISGTNLKIAEGFADAPISLDLKGVTYFEAVRALAKASGNQIVSTSKWPECSLGIGKGIGQSSAASGPLLGLCTRTLLWPADAHARPVATCSVHFDAILESRITAHSYLPTINVISAKTDSGEVLTPLPQPWPQYMHGTYRSKGLQNVYFQLTQPTKPYKTIDAKVQVVVSAFTKGAPESRDDWDQVPVSIATFELDLRGIDLRGLEDKR